MSSPHLRFLFIAALSCILCIALSDGTVSSLIRQEETNATQSDGNSTQPNSPSTDKSSTNASLASPFINSPLSKLSIYTFKPSLGTPRTSIVYTNNRLTGIFNSCTLDTPVNSSLCFQDDIFNDRLTFRFNFQYNASIIREAFRSTPPSVSAASFASALASPVVIEPQVTDDTTAVVVVLYNCKLNNHGIVPLRLTVHLGDSEQERVVIQWQKACQSGVNSNMLFGYISDTADADHHQFGHDTAALLTVAPSDVSTECFLKLDQVGAQQVFLAPLVTTSDESIVSVALRGNHPAGGVLEGLQQSRFQIGYLCHGQGKATIRTSIAIPPFQNVSAMWSKDCGGSVATKLQVGSKLDGFDIVDDGKPTPRYMVAVENIGTEHSEEHRHLPDNETEWVFYIKNDNDLSGSPMDAALHVSRVLATIENPKVLFSQSPKAMELVQHEWRVTTRSTYALAAGHSLKVVMPMVCKNVGESRVLITLPVLGHQELEFGVAKECTHVGVSHKAREFILTVNTVFGLGVVAVICVLAFVYVRRRSSKLVTGFEPVPLTER